MQSATRARDKGYRRRVLSPGWGGLGSLTRCSGRRDRSMRGMGPCPPQPPDWRVHPPPTPPAEVTLAIAELPGLLDQLLQVLASWRFRRECKLRTQKHGV